MTEDMLTIFLCRIDNAPSIGGCRGSADEFLCIGEEMPPLREEEIHDPKVFALCFGVCALRGQEMDVCIATEVAFGVHIAPPFDTERQLTLSGFYVDSRPQRRVFKAARDINDNISTREPSLTRAIDIGVTNLPQSHIAADIYVPCAVV